MPPLSGLARRVRKTIDRRQLLPPGARVIVALSGGPDSMALTAVLRELAPELALTVAGIAHLNHQLRGAASDEDEAFCVRHAGSLALPIRTGRVDVAALAERESRSIEDAARAARYQFLAQAANELGADHVAVGHTRDDQAETFLLRLLRGSGARGLAGIHPRAGHVVRPLIDVDRRDVLEYLSESGIEFREDETNRDTRFARNRVRHELLPHLKADYSPSIVDHLAHATEIARADDEVLDAITAQVYARIAHLSEGNLTVSTADLLFEPLAVQRRLILKGLRAVAPKHSAGFDHVEEVLALIRSAGTVVDVPGVRAERSGGTLVLRPRKGRGPRLFPRPRTDRAIL